VSAGRTAAQTGVVPDDDHPLLVATIAPDPRLPNGFVGAVSLPATLVVALASAALWQHSSLGMALGAMAVVVGLIAYWSRLLAGAATAALGWLALNGFVVGDAGQLQWHGSADAVRLAVLFGVALAASGTHALGIRLSRRVILQEFAVDAGVRYSALSASRVGAESRLASGRPTTSRGARHA
jgi:hypothetical protein